MTEFIYFTFGLALGAGITGILWFFWTEEDQTFGDRK